MIKLVVFDLMGVLFVEPLIIKKLARWGDSKKLEKLRMKNHNGRVMKRINKPLMNIEKKIIEKVHLDKDSYDVVDYLLKKYKLAIISDLPKAMGDRLIEKYKFDKLFYPVLISGTVGVTKKHKKIFQMLIKDTEINAEEIIFIDNEKENLKTASEVGIKTVWFDIEKDRFKFDPDYTIKSLKDLKKIL